MATQQKTFLQYFNEYRWRIQGEEGEAASSPLAQICFGSKSCILPYEKAYIHVP